MGVDLAKLQTLLVLLRWSDEWMIGGGRGYLMKEKIATDLVDAIRTMVGGRRHVSASMARELARHGEKPSDPNPES